MIERTAPNTKKVLVVDFDPDYLKLLAQWLSREGFQVITATDGLSGLEKFKKEHPDLVVLEAMLPRLHGFELCSKITTDSERRTPVIITTNVYKDAAYRTEAMRTFGATAYFEKPPDRVQFLAQARRSAGLVDPPRPVPVQTKRRSPADLLASLSLESGNGRKAAPAPRPDARPKVPDHSAIDDLLQDTLAEFGLKGDKAAGAPAAAKPRPAPVPVAPPVRPDVRNAPKSQAAPPASAPGPGESPLRRPEARPAPRPAGPATVSSMTIPPVPVKTRAEADAPAWTPRSEAQAFAATPPAPPAAAAARREAAPEIRASSPPSTLDEPVIPAFGTPAFQEFMAPRKPFPVKVAAAAAGVVLTGALAFLFLGPGKDRGTEVPNVEVQSVAQALTLETDPADDPLPTEDNGAGDVESAAAATTDPPVVKKIDQPQYKQTPQAPPPSPELKPVVPVRSAGPEIRLAEPAADRGAASAPPAGDAAAAARERGTGEAGGSESAAASLVTPPAQATDPAARPEPENPSPAPLPKAKAGDLVALESADVQPVTLKKAPAVYPPRAFQAGREASVTVNALISERGEVLQVVYLRGAQDFGFDKAAIAAVEKWRFQPALKDGVAVKVWKPITINFRKN